MYIRDLIPKGAMVTPKMPSYGIYQNVLLTDKRRGVFPAAVGPQAKLDMTGDSEKFVMLQGLSPAMFRPKDLAGDMASMRSLLERHERKIDWKVSAYTPQMRQATLPENAWQSEDEFWIARDSQMVYGTMPTLSYIWWLNGLQEEIMRKPLSPTAFAEPIGLGVMYDEQGGNDLLYPKKTVNINKTIQFEMHVPQETFVMRIRREISKWQVAVAAAAKDLNTICKGRGFPDDVYLSWAAYTLGAYSGFSDSFDDNTRYTTEDVFQDAFSYMGLPFSDTWPDLSYDADQFDSETVQMYKHLFMLNNLLSMAGKRVGGKLVPVQYLWKRGNIFVVKQMLKEYIKAPLDMGGSNNIWMQPAINTSVPFGVLFPTPIVDGNCEWKGNTPEKGEQFSDAMIDRAEIALSNLDEMNTNYRVVTSRDSRVRLVTEHGREYFIIYNRINADGRRKTKTPLGHEILLSYLSDATLKFTGAVYVSASFMRPKYSFSLGPTPIIDTKILGIGKRIPLPGGIVDVDAGTVQALADQQAPKNIAEARSLSGDGAGTKVVPPILSPAETGVVTGKESK
jgi:hypothetical protein